MISYISIYSILFYEHTYELFCHNIARDDMKAQQKYTCNETILRSARVCHYAFMDVDRAREYPHFQHMRRYHNKKTDVLIDVWNTGQSSKVISFRGSASIQNILSYCQNDMEPFSFCDKSMKIHTGVLRLLESVHDDILHSIESQKHVLFTGYSLGGALAIVAALYFALVFPKIKVSCHTFGTPMVGDQEFMKLFETYVPISIHIINQMDIIPRLLPYPMICTRTSCSTYQQVPLERRVCIPSKDVKKDIVHSICHPLHLHDIKTYIENLEHLMAEARQL